MLFAVEGAIAWSEVVFIALFVFSGLVAEDVVEEHRETGYVSLVGVGSIIILWLLGIFFLVLD